MELKAKQRLILFAPRVRVTGGLKLLKLLLHAKPKDIELIAAVDPSVTDVADCQRVVANNGILGNLRAELWLRNFAQPNDIVLCFHNQGPLFRNRAQVWAFVQNRFIVDERIDFMPKGLKFRMFLKRFLFFCTRRNASKFIVQCESMRLALIRHWPKTADRTVIWPFTEAQPKVPSMSSTEKIWDFIFVSAGEPQKNHSRLLKAWHLLAEQGQFPTLALTVCPRLYPALAQEIAESQAAGLKIDNHAEVDSSEIQKLYAKSRALIFPSVFESFGLPLLEAKAAGLAIVASELDYVRDSVDLDQSFDPYSAISIARAVQRQMQLPSARVKVLEPIQFLEKLLAGR